MIHCTHDIVTFDIDLLQACKRSCNEICTVSCTNVDFTEWNLSSSLLFKYVQQLGRQYGVRQTTFAEYVADLKANNSRARNSYLAVQNIRKAFPELQVRSSGSNLASYISLDPGWRLAMRKLVTYTIWAIGAHGATCHVIMVIMLCFDKFTFLEV